MTREEAINFGEMFLKVNNDSKNSNTYEFIETAVKLFKQEPILDKIRAEVDELNVLKFSSGERIYKDEVLDIIDKYKAEIESEDGSN